MLEGFSHSANLHKGTLKKKEKKKLCIYQLHYDTNGEHTVAESKDRYIIASNHCQTVRDQSI